MIHVVPLTTLLFYSFYVSKFIGSFCFENAHDLELHLMVLMQLGDLPGVLNTIYCNIELIQNLDLLQEGRLSRELRYQIRKRSDWFALYYELYPGKKPYTNLSSLFFIDFSVKVYEKLYLIHVWKCCAVSIPFLSGLFYLSGYAASCVDVFSSFF